MGINFIFDSIIVYLLDCFEGICVVEVWGEWLIFYNSGFMLLCGVYFVIVKEKDGENDKVLNFDCSGVFCFNVGIIKLVFLEWFGLFFVCSGKGGVIDGLWDFIVVDMLMFYFVYGWMSWVVVLNLLNEILVSMFEIVEVVFGKVKMFFEKKV